MAAHDALSLRYFTPQSDPLTGARTPGRAGALRGGSAWTRRPQEQGEGLRAALDQTPASAYWSAAFMPRCLTAWWSGFSVYRHFRETN